MKATKLMTGLSVVACAALADPAMAAQANANDVRCPRNLMYNQTTGVCVSADSSVNPPTFYYNGEPAQLSNVKTVGESFDYGDGLGLMCEGVSQTGTTGFSAAASANQACNTTCGNSACVIATDGTDLVACTDATADSCLCQTSSLDRVLLGCGANWEAPALGVTLITTSRGFKLGHVALLAQDIGPDMDAAADGLDIAGDQTDDDGVEVFSGVLGASGAPMVPGVDPAFQLCVTFEADDVSGTDELWFGFRSVEEPNATFNSYDTYATLGFDNGTGDWHSETEDDGAGLDTDDLSFDALVDDTQVVGCVRVDDNRRVSYSVDGTVITDPDTFTFDSGEQVIPFFHFLHDSDLMDELFIQEWEVSYYNDGD